MLTVKCAHCGAGNRNVTEQDVCFQCGNVLGAAPASRGKAFPIDVKETTLLSGLPSGVTLPQQQAVAKPEARTRRYTAYIVAAVVIVAGLILVARLLH
jgi:hypothetical protein